MFLHHLAAGLVFSSGAGLSRLAIVEESLVLMVAGLGTAMGGLAWFAHGGPRTKRRKETLGSQESPSGAPSAAPTALSTR